MKLRKMLLVLLPALILTGCSKGTTSNTSPTNETSSTKPSSAATVYITDFSIDFTTAELEVGERKTITATIAPKNTTTKGFEYSTDKAEIATVTNEGVIEGKSIGSATITVTSKGKKADGNKVVKTIAVQVKATAISDLTVDFSKALLKEGETKQITATVLPANATEKGVAYASSDAAIATVSNTGLITAVKEGTCNVTVTSVGKNSEDKVIVKTIAVTIESLTAKHKVTFVNYDDSIIQAIDEINADDVPAFSEEIPQKPTDENGIYIFRGFDKEIVAYVESEDTVVYKAVYEKTQCQATKASLVNENNVATVVVRGETVGFNAETEASFASTAGLEFMKRGGDWASTRVSNLTPTLNADKTWTIKASYSDLGITEDGLDHIGRFVWNNATNATDLKVHHLGGDTYRHDAEGIVHELKASGNTQEETDAYNNSIKGPTWIGLGLTYEENTVTIDNLDYNLFSNSDNYDCVSGNVVKSNSITPTSVNLVQTAVEENTIVNYQIKGTSKGYPAGELTGLVYDFQHNDNVDHQGWVNGYDNTVAGALTSLTINEDKTWTFNIPVSTIASLHSETVVYDFLVHFGGPDGVLSGDGHAADLKTSVAEEYAPITLGNYTYSIAKNGANWDIPALVVTYNAPKA